MHKSLIALAGAASIGLASLAAPAPANAGCVGCWVGAGLLGGLFAGAVVGTAIANSPPPGYYYPPPPPGYYPPPPGAYYPPPPPGAYGPPPPGAPARPLMRSLRRAVTGESARSGSKALAISGEPSKFAR